MEKYTKSSLQEERLKNFGESSEKEDLAVEWSKSMPILNCNTKGIIPVYFLKSKPCKEVEIHFPL